MVKAEAVAEDGAVPLGDGQQCGRVCRYLAQTLLKGFALRAERCRELPRQLEESISVGRRGVSNYDIGSICGRGRAPLSPMEANFEILAPWSSF